MKVKYGAYQTARDGAWQCLIDNEIDALPVDLMKIARNAGIKVLRNSVARVLTGARNGISQLIDDRWVLVYEDEDTPPGRQRFTQAHEFGHIFLGHELIAGAPHYRTFDLDKPEVESEADVFAARLLAPACVLWGLGVREASEITTLCGMSLAAANIRAQRMGELYRRDMFLAHPLERQVFEQFKGFIEDHKA